jgi:manganese/iron transport system permease protein
MEFDLATALMPFRFGFMQNAFAISIIVSVPTALLSCFLVLKGWALMGDAISHAILPGIVLAHLIGAPLILGAFAAGMWIVLFVALDSGVHLDHILFGNMLGVSATELWQSGLIAGGVVLILVLKWKDWLLHSFDPAQAKAAGLWVNTLHYGLLALISLTIVATLTAAGLILAIALLIAPGAIAFLLVRRFSTMLWVSVLLCMGSMLIGTYASFFLDSAPAPTIVLVQTALFIAAFLRRQILNRRASLRAVH